MSSTYESSSNAVSKAISSAAATSATTTTAQTRFSFYDAQEVELQISSSENKESLSMKSSSTPENSDSNIQATNNSSNNSNFSNNQQHSRKELATVDSNTIGIDVMPPAQQQTATTPTSNIGNISISTSMPTVDSQGTEEILRSLQETEEQRRQLLGVTMPPGTAATSSTDPTRRPAMFSQQDVTCANDQSSNGSNSNPYEDAIKEALDLLRRHRSPAASPAFATKVGGGGGGGGGGFVSGGGGISNGGAYPQTVALEGGMIRPKTPTSSTESAAIPTTREELTDAYEEARLKAKQRQERMAKYASRLQEFKSGMTTTPKATPTNVNSTFTSNNTAWQQVAHHTKDEVEDEDHVVVNTTATSHNDTSHYSDTIRQVGTTDDSVGFSDLSQSTKQREEEVQRGVEKVLLAILEKANSSRGRAEQRQQYEQEQQHHHGDSYVGGGTTGTVADAAHQLSLQTHSQDSMGDTLIRAMDELLLGPQPYPGQHLQQQPQLHHHSSIDPLKNTSSRDSCVDSINTGNQSRNSKSVVDELLAEVDDDVDVVAIPSTVLSPPAVSPVAPAELSTPTSTGITILGKTWDTSTTSAAEQEQQHQHQHREEKKLPDSMEKDHHNDHAVTLNSVVLHSADEEQSGFHAHHDDVDDLVQGFLNSPEKDPSADEDESGDGGIMVDDDVDDDHVEDDEDDRYAEHIEDDDDDQSDVQQNSNSRVLGPLSQKAGGTTGVVLDIEEHDEDKSETHHQQQHVDVDDSNNASGPLSHVMNYVTSAATTESKEIHDRYAIEQQNHHDDQQLSQAIEDSRTDESEDKNGNDSDDDDDDDNDSDDDGSTNDAESNDTESMELMRTLCAHLLPFGVDQSNSLLDAIPDWDEDNPNEAGYRIIRLSRSQLRSVEYAFETMIKATSERRLNGIDPNAEGNDANFAKELQEAEKLLDDEEKRRQLLEATSSSASISSKNSKSRNDKKAPLIPGALQIDDGESDEDRESMVEGSSSALCHPDFPGIRATGKGEMGDLEYFHLPILFKSHVTGFEPTKDLVLEPGNVVASQYLVESELGSAAFSTAYRCVDLSSDGEDGHEEVCLKVIKNTKDFFDQSLDEIKILELLRQTGRCHENHCVEMKTFFYYREHLVIVTELLRQNLFEFGKFILDNDEEPYFTIPRLAYITRQALTSLKFVHSLGLVHSDVKPENILLGSYSRAQIKLIDFGSSCYLTDRQSSYIQSRSYRAPEVVLGLPYDGRIDVWSLGCVVAEMYTGEVTFQNDSIVSMLSRIEAICGPFPRHMIAQGRQSGRFFSKSGLLYEFVDDSDRDGSKSAPGPHDDSDDENDSSQFDIFQPKKTRLSSRLGFAADLMDGVSEEDYRTIRHSDPERYEEVLFTDFVSRLLTIDPDGRPTAAEALKHPWMQYALSLTEEQIKYPSS